MIVMDDRNGDMIVMDDMNGDMIGIWMEIWYEWRYDREWIDYSIIGSKISTYVAKRMDLNEVEVECGTIGEGDIR